MLLHVQTSPLQDMCDRLIACAFAGTGVSETSLSMPHLPTLRRQVGFIEAQPGRGGVAQLVEQRTFNP